MRAGILPSSRDVTSGAWSALRSAALLLAAGLAPQLHAQQPVLGPYSGPLNVPQTNPATSVQAAPAIVVLSGTNFTASTTVTLGSFGSVAVKLVSTSTLSFAVPAAFSSSPVGTTAAISVCNGSAFCATGVSLTVTALVPSVGSITATPTPVTTAGTTTLDSTIQA